MFRVAKKLTINQHALDAALNSGHPVMQVFRALQNLGENYICDPEWWGATDYPYWYSSENEFPLLLFVTKSGEDEPMLDHIECWWVNGLGDLVHV